ncbi:MAG TPA: hypothetical protein VHB79_12575 [Polyangiaceae bacterium]|nr:hypothetical protein [Polyangiaceae bacterium]
MLAKLSRNQLLLGALGLALLVTPYLACSSSDKVSDSAETPDELRSKLVGTWQGSAEIDSETIPFSLSLEPRGATSTAERLGVVGSLTSENPYFDGAVDGYFGIDVANHRVTLSLRLDDGKTLLGTLEGETLSDGRIENVAHAGTFGLSRP